MNKIPKGQGLMLAYEYENNYFHHKKRLQKISTRSNQQFRHQSQIQIANTFKRNFQKGEYQKFVRRQKKIQNENEKLCSFLMKQYNRPRDTAKLSERLTDSRKSKRSVSERKVQLQNAKLLQKILVVQSSLSKSKLDKDYKKLRQTKERLLTQSSQSKKRLHSGLKKMNIKPMIFFPEIKKKKSVESGRKSSRNV